MTQSALSIVARILIATIYFMSAIGNKIPKFSDVATAMQAEGVPAPSILLAGSIVFLIAGSLSILAGFKARFGALLLLAFLALATYYFHDFWNFQGPEQQSQLIQFMKNLSLIGTMAFLIANGPGAGSLDGWLASRSSMQPTSPTTTPTPAAFPLGGDPTK